MSKIRKIAVVLSGSGVLDGSEIHEATLTLYFITKHSGTYEVFAPDIKQHHVINHITGKEMNETRNVLVESARIARGKISSLSEFNARNFDAIIFPGGLGAAKNLSSFAFDAANCMVNEDVSNAIRKMHELKKPIGALCISPAIVAKVLGNVEVTIGQDANIANAIKSMGAVHKTTTLNGEIVVDVKNKVVTTPCYMLNSNIAQIGEGAENLVKAIFEIC